jgi:DNA-binding CsgD family transcriptional regulator
MISRPVNCPRMVGRRKQLDLLIERGRGACASQGSVVVIEGVAGAGKTRLVSEACMNLRAAGMRVGGGACVAYAQSPLGPFAQAIKLLIADEPGIVPRGTAERSIIAQLIPEFSDTHGATVARSESADKLRLFDTLTSLLLRAGSSRPLTLVIEDIHWADTASVELLAHVTRAIAAAPVCVFCTYRSDELPPGDPVRTSLAKLEREPVFWRVELAPLSDREMESFIAETLPGSDAIDAETAHAIRRRSEGNPLFAEELLRIAIGSESRRLGARALPNSIRETVLERLSQLDEFDRSLLRTAAAIGRRFTPELLATIEGGDHARVLPVMKRALASGLVVESEKAGAFEFRHALMADAVYSDLMAAEARTLHAKIATAIEALPDYPERVSELAHQWWAAGDREKTAIYCEKAGDAAEAVFASQDAALYFQRALDSTAESDERRAYLWRKLAWSLYRSGMAAKARSAFESAVEQFIENGNRREAASTLINLAHLQWTLADIAGHLDATQRAIELVGDDERDPSWFSGRVQLAWSTALRRCDTDEALRLLAEAERGKAEPPLWDRVKFHECTALVQILRGSPADALRDAEAGVSMSLAAGDIGNAVRCWGNVGILAAQCGDRALSLDAFGRALDLIDRSAPLGWPVPWALALFAHAQFLYGDLESAERTIERAIGVIHDVPSLDVLVAWVAIPLGIRLEKHELVDRCADEGLIDFAFASGTSLIGDVASAFSEYYLSRGRAPEAADLLDRALASLVQAPKPGDYDVVFTLIAEHCERPSVERARGLLETMARATKVRSVPAYLALFDAIATKRFGTAEESAANGARAAELFEALQWPLLRARALELAGMFQPALVIYSSVGDRANGRRLEDLVAPKNVRGRRKDELSARELEIAKLVVAGKTNREIAADLVLSERTVESHVSSMFGKLHARSRREFAERFKAYSASTAKGGSSA